MEEGEFCNSCLKLLMVPCATVQVTGATWQLSDKTWKQSLYLLLLWVLAKARKCTLKYNHILSIVSWKYGSDCVLYTCNLHVPLNCRNSSRISRWNSANLIYSDDANYLKTLLTYFENDSCKLFLKTLLLYFESDSCNWTTSILRIIHWVLCLIHLISLQPKSLF